VFSLQDLWVWTWSYLHGVYVCPQAAEASYPLMPLFLVGRHPVSFLHEATSRRTRSAHLPPSSRPLHPPPTLSDHDALPFSSLTIGPRSHRPPPSRGQVRRPGHSRGRIVFGGQTPTAASVLHTHCVLHPAQGMGETPTQHPCLPLKPTPTLSCAFDPGRGAVRQGPPRHREAGRAEGLHGEVSNRGQGFILGSLEKCARASYYWTRIDS